jgi:hypothetical protein
MTTIVETSSPTEPTPAAETAEAVAEAAVEIAEINAERDVEIAQIHADERIATVEADFEARVEVEEIRAGSDEQWQALSSRMETLATELATLSNRVSSLAMTQQATAEAAMEAEAIAETALEASTVLAAPEPSKENADARQEAESKKEPSRRRKAFLRL